MPAQKYDTDNILAKIIRGDIPNNTVFEDDHVLAFHDIAPRAKTHILVIPKGAYIDIADFSANGSDAEIVAFHRAIARITAENDLDGQGFRTISNSGDHGGQEIPHFHVHILGGEKLGPILCPCADTQCADKCPCTEECPCRCRRTCPCTCPSPGRDAAVGSKCCPCDGDVCENCDCQKGDCQKRNSQNGADKECADKGCACCCRCCKECPCK